MAFGVFFCFGKEENFNGEKNYERRDETSGK